MLYFQQIRLKNILQMLDFSFLINESFYSNFYILDIIWKLNFKIMFFTLRFTIDIFEF